MTSFNWRVLSKNTLRSYELAARDFETVTGCPVQNADEVSIAAFKASMEGRRLNVNTIRKRLSAVAVMSGVKVELPRRQKAERCPTLNAEQVHALMSVVTDGSDRMLLVKLLTLGIKARTITTTPELFGAHFAGELPERALTAQEITRRLKRYGRNAGLNDVQISLRVWCQTGRRLMDTLSLLDLVNVIGHAPDDLGQHVQWKQLHGIGRRSKHAII